MEEKKFYIGYNAAEGTSHFTVELTEAEHEAIKKFCDSKYVNCFEHESFDGDFGISDIGFSTKEEAINTFYNGVWH